MTRGFLDLELKHARPNRMDPKSPPCPSPGEWIGAIVESTKLLRRAGLTEDEIAAGLDPLIAVAQRCPLAAAESVRNALPGGMGRGASKRRQGGE